MLERRAADLQTQLAEPLLKATGWRLQVCPELTSTSDWLWQQPLDSQWANQVVIALQQTAGRGQRGKVWQSPLGGLYLSVALCPQIPATEGARLLFGSACGVAQALNQRGVPVRLKWPNDLLLEGRKLGGLLPETRLRGGQIQATVVGLGLNLANPVPQTGINLSQVDVALAAAVAELSLAMLTGLADALSRWLDLERSWTDLLPEYRHWLDSLGQAVKLADGQRAVVRDVLPNGHLLLRTEGGVWQEVAAGEIQLGYAAVGLAGAGAQS